MELISKIKRTFKLYKELDRISTTIKHRNDLKDIIEELAHYPNPVLALAIIEAVKKSMQYEKRSCTKEQVFDETMNLIYKVHHIGEQIDMGLVHEIAIKEVH